MKFSGVIGFWEEDHQVKPGVFKPEIIERRYDGDVVRDMRKYSGDLDSVNGKFRVNNRIGIMTDLYFREKWPTIRYVEWNGTRFKVSNVEVGYPRTFLDLGEVYND